LGWIFCKLLEGIDAAVKSFYEEVEGQLCVKSGLSTTKGGENSAGDATNVCVSKTDSGPKNYLTADLNKAWSSMRVIATSILVIVMLIGIIGHAAGGGKS
jgi:hypothetical protein